MLSSSSKRAPRSRTTDLGQMTVSLTVGLTVLLTEASLVSRDRLPNVNRPFAALSPSRRHVHHNAMAAVQL